MKLDIPQLVLLAGNAGFSGSDLVTAVSVALAESGGDPQAYNPETKAGTPINYGSFGLWQIYLKAHPEFSGSNLFDPPTNANAAFSVYRDAGGTFQPWSSFQSGAYLAYAGSVGAAISPAPDSSAVVAQDDSVDPGIDPATMDASLIDPGSGGILTIVAVGGLLFWVVQKAFNG